MINKNICIIGGLGFVGRNLIEMLHSSNKITVLDIIDKPIIFDKNINYINVKVHKYDILKDQLFDYIFYLVGNASVTKSVNNPIFDLKKNTIELLKVLEIIKINKTKLIYASTAACYGEMNNIPTRFIDKPISPYGISKLTSEYYLKYYNNEYNIPVLICRFFSLYGEYNRKQVIYDTTIRLLKSNNDKIDIYNPDSKRDFIYIKEAINAVLFLCKKNQFNGEVFDIGHGETKSIFEIYLEISEILKISKKSNKIKKEFIGDPEMQISNPKKLKDLGFSFEGKHLKNLIKTINWIKENNNE